MKEQIAAAEMAGSVLADEILEALESVDQLEKVVVEAKERLAAGKTELAKFRDTVAQESQVVAGDVKRLEAELTEAEKGLPADFRDDYDRVIRAKGADGMARMEDGCCEGCGQSVTLNQQNYLILSKPVFCTACGRLLYRGAGLSAAEPPCHPGSAEGSGRTLAGDVSAESTDRAQPLRGSLLRPGETRQLRSSLADL